MGGASGLAEVGEVSDPTLRLRRAGKDTPQPRAFRFPKQINNNEIAGGPLSASPATLLETGPSLSPRIMSTNMKACFFPCRRAITNTCWVRWKDRLTVVVYE